MAFEIKNAEDFSKWTKEQEDRFETIKDLPSQVGELGAQMKEIKGVVEQLNARPVAAPGGNKIVVPVKARDFARAGMNAILKAPTGVRRSAPGIYDAGEDEFARFQDVCDKALLFATHKRWIRGDGDTVTPSQLRAMPFYADEYLPALRAVQAITKDAFSTSDAGHADEWVPTEYSRRLWEKIRLEYRVAGLFEEIAIPRSPFEMPTFLGDLTAYRHVEPTNGAIAAGTALTDGRGTGTTTGKMTFNAETLAMIVGYSWELDDDSIVAMLPFLERALVFGIRNGIENAILNGDDDGTHMDSDSNSAGATSAVWAWDGLRNWALAGTADLDHSNQNIDSDAEFQSEVGGVRAAMGVYGVDGTRCAIITGPRVANQFRAIPMFSTAYAFGEMAQNRMANQNSGGLSLQGMPLVISEFSREDLNASGVYDGSTTDRCNVIVVNTDVWKLGVQRTIKTKVLDQTYAAYGQTAVIASWRGDFQSALPATSNATGMVFNIART